MNTLDEARLAVLLDVQRPSRERAAAAIALGASDQVPRGSVVMDRVQLWLGQRIRDRGESREVRIACIEAMAARAEGAYVIDLRTLTLAAGDDPEVRRAALKAHAAVKPHERHHALIASELEQARTGNPYTLRSAVGWWGGRPEILAVIDELKDDHDPRRRGEAAYCAASVGDTSIALTKLVTDPDPLVRQMAAAALEVSGWKTNQESTALRAALKDKPVSKAARTALRKLGFDAVPKPGRAAMPDGLKGNARLEEWWQALADMSRQLLADESLRAELDEAMVRSGWLGFSGASREGIESAEKRLGRALPGSYRDFLRVSDGWQRGPNFPYRWFGANEIDWFRVKEPEWVRIWTEETAVIEENIPDDKYFVYGQEQDSVSMRREYLNDCLQVAEPIDGYVYLLNPDVVTAEGEWEAWLFGNKLAGATRYRSWRDLVWQEWHDLRENRRI
jgi:hypothetical protein